MDNFGKKYNKYIEIGFVLLFFMAFFGVTQKGMLCTNDSFDYWAAAQSFYKDFSFRRANGSNYVFWSPLYPIFLAFLPIWAVKIAHFMAFLISFYFLGLFAKRLTKKYSILFLAICCFSTEIFMVHVFLWTEAIFLSLFLAYLYFFSEKRLKIASILGFLMLLQRNSGFFLWIGVLFKIIYDISQKEKITFLEIVGHISFVLLGFSLRNLYVWYFYEPNLMASWIGQGNIFESYKAVSLTLSAWFLPSFLGQEIRILLITVLFSSIYLLNFSDFKKLSSLSQSSFFMEISYLTILIFISPQMVDLPRLLVPILPLFFLRFFSLLEKLYFQRLILVCMVGLIFYTSIRWTKNVYEFWGRDYVRIEKKIA